MKVSLFFSFFCFFTFCKLDCLLLANAGLPSSDRNASFLWFSIFSQSLFSDFSVKTKKINCWLERVVGMELCKADSIREGTLSIVPGCDQQFQQFGSSMPCTGIVKKGSFSLLFFFFFTFRSVFDTKYLHVLWILFLLIISIRTSELIIILQKKLEECFPHKLQHTNRVKELLIWNKTFKISNGACSLMKRDISCNQMR